jgi:AraC-like DNA-binding protein
MQDQLPQLRDLVLRHAEGPRTQTAIPRVVISVGRHATTHPVPSVYEPMLCVVLQGAKEVMIGERQLHYDPASCFIGTLELPASGCVVKASPEEPYLALSLALDRDGLAGLLSELPPGSRPDAEAAGFGVCPVTPQLLDVCLRLLSLLDEPQAIPVLVPLLEREILYRLLQGPHGEILRQVARSDSRLFQIRQAIAWIRTHFDQPLRIEALAELSGMSPASFHRHFKAATAMSPLQYQKQLRLQEARKLLIGRQDAARAAYAVGYESPSQFSREYARLFGAPPARDAVRLRGEGEALLLQVDAPGLG